MRETCAHFRLADFLRPGESYHFADLELHGDNGARYHDHDYHEVFWVKAGAGAQRLNGRPLPLGPGELWLVRPADRHVVRGDPAAGLRVVNVAFPGRAWAAVRRRYFAGGRDPFAGSRRVWLADDRALAALAHCAERLAAPGRPRVALDGFLMELPGLLAAAGPEHGAEEGMPDWLARACREIAQPAHFQGGTRAFARLAGRSPAHVAREALRRLGRTPTDFVNAARLDHSARQLATTARPIADIALDSGLNNLSHFYALFRKRFGLSPRRYRLQAHSTVRG